jgi:hypothetical protein
MRRFKRTKTGTTMLGANTIGNSKIKIKPGSFIKYLIKAIVGTRMTAAPIRFQIIRKRAPTAFRTESTPTMRAEIPNKKSGMPTQKTKLDVTSPLIPFITPPSAPMRRA